VRKRINELAVVDPVVVVGLNRTIEASNRGEEMEDQILVAVHVVTTLVEVRILIAEMAVDLRVDIHKDLSIVLLATLIIAPRDP
jgi:hydroxymethylpyrimidine/phosphomethylpyrimidine kinase